MCVLYLRRSGYKAWPGAHWIKEAPWDFNRYPGPSPWTTASSVSLLRQHRPQQGFWFTATLSPMNINSQTDYLLIPHFLCPISFYCTSKCLFVEWAFPWPWNRLQGPQLDITGHTRVPHILCRTLTSGALYHPDLHPGTDKEFKKPAQSQSMPGSSFPAQWRRRLAVWGMHVPTKEIFPDHPMEEGREMPLPSSKSHEGLSESLIDWRFQSKGKLESPSPEGYLL